MLALLLAIAALGFRQSFPVPTGPAEGNEIAYARPLSSEPATLRVATFNIDGGVGRDGREDLARVEKLIAGYDVVGLQEVHGRNESDNQAKNLSQQCGPGWLFAPVERRWAGRTAFGNGLLCDLVVQQWRRVPIASASSRTNRNAIVVRALWRGRPLTIVVTHLDRHEDRDAELERVIAMFLQADSPAILLGDLNTTATDPRLAALRTTPGVVDPLGQSLGSAFPADNVDWILVRGLRSLAAGIKPTDASDHNLAWAELAEQEAATAPALPKN
jgi:endonuclease/exonuclease/phosphatase family metal-dependent hydrolase